MNLSDAATVPHVGRGKHGREHVSILAAEVLHRCLIVKIYPVEHDQIRIFTNVLKEEFENKCQSVDAAKVLKEAWVVDVPIRPAAVEDGVERLHRRESLRRDDGAELAEIYNDLLQVWQFEEFRLRHSPPQLRHQ